MHRTQKSRAVRSGAFLTRLARDKRGSTLAIMAATLIPLAGMVGGGIDLSRMYIVKTRLQHACDSGALAGRKAMGAGRWNYNNYAARTEAERMFDANIEASPYGATGLTRRFDENAGKVSGVASATVPMTLMRIFGSKQATLSVQCDAEMQLPNTDVMFVLDTTGSMGSKAASGDTDTKIVSLKKAVKCFFETVAKLDTDAVCNGTPSGGVGNQVQVRFGFVPYSMDVNVGKLLPSDYFPDSWKYQTRLPMFKTGYDWVQSGTPAVQKDTVSRTGVPYYYCTDANAATLNTSSSEVNGSSKQVTDVTYKVTGWNSNSYGTCIAEQTTTKTTYTWHQTNAFDKWHYAYQAQDISGLKNPSGGWNDKVKLPIGSEGKMVDVPWDGCIEERQTKYATSYSPLPTGVYDLNIDMLPSRADPTTQWGPALRGAIYKREVSGNNYYDPIDTPNDMPGASSYTCPTEARLLDEWTSATTFDNYVDSLSVGGNTYHDIGLLWGARLMSPTGLFAARNNNKPTIMRHLIFMTDGDTNAQTEDYVAYGVPWWDRRQTPSGSPPSKSQLDDQVNKRFLAICTAVKNMNVTLWVISFGTGSNSTTEGRLEQCATGGHYYVARDSLALQQVFSSIAGKISQLRITQ